MRKTLCYIFDCSDEIADDSHFCPTHKYNGGNVLSQSQMTLSNKGAAS